MSYGIYICDENNEVIDLGISHGIHGTTYCEEESELYLNVTFNYRSFFQEVFVCGIHALDGDMCYDTYEMLATAMNHCITYHSDDLTPSEDPWKPTWGDFFHLLTKLMNLSMLAPHGIWKIES